ncbi:hypothetical protein MES5069_230236 [Mesorhizobium escarrei]|uniref:Uncharacterized protein n=1 Tax=Mesorhizobium escarrei TaxID=666018 RepID=A0ABM9DT85_9HYPH|nr:hypothetical protein MES5069_230236 [Mesorhizobium escarrei]
MMNGPTFDERFVTDWMNGFVSTLDLCLACLQLTEEGRGAEFCAVKLPSQTVVGGTIPGR